MVRPSLQVVEALNWVFFNSGSSKNRYLGIWYKKVATGIMVRVANREIPLTESSGVLKNPNVHLLEHEAWKKQVTGQDRYLSSWKSFDDPSRGNFTYKLDLGGCPQTLVRNGLVVKFSSEPWNEDEEVSACSGLVIESISESSLKLDKSFIHSSGQMVSFLTLEIQHIVNSLTGAVQIPPSIRFHFNSLTDATCNGLSLSLSRNHSRKSYPKVTSQRLARGKLVHFYGWKSLALPSVGPAKTTKLCILALGTFPGNLSSKELELRNLVIGGLQGVFWDLDNKNLMQNISNVGSKYRDASGTILQEKMVSARFRRHSRRAAKSFCNNMLTSQGCEVGFHLEVLSSQLAAYIRQLQEGIHNTVQKGCEITSQQKGDFAALCKMLPSAWSDWLPLAVTSSFQL
ncbi:hypothetical protein CK203_056058 [Vitis vinifera]|uniref:Uncharacterized protein n=1 Tax=Vitis vinifera TaxID=29760 RepID=A0A438G913_VITVI|nr:hypothetical protein CK203_056058 [Vitis vinifera]